MLVRRALGATLPKPYPTDLRERMIEAVAAGHLKARRRNSAGSSRYLVVIWVRAGKRQEPWRAQRRRCTAARRPRRISAGAGYTTNGFDSGRDRRCDDQGGDFEQLHHDAAFLRTARHQPANEAPARAAAKARRDGLRAATLDTRAELAWSSTAELRRRRDGAAAGLPSARRASHRLRAAPKWDDHPFRDGSAPAQGGGTFRA
jgi:hypothetical protein